MNYEEIIKKMGIKERLNYSEIKYIIDGYLNNDITNEQMTEFLKLICKNSLSFRETLDLTDIMLKSGDIINLTEVEKNKVDKHSTGGIGDKVSLIVGPIVASLGLAMPKMSGKGLGITGGTIDKLKSIPGYNTNIDNKKFIEIINEIGVSIISQSGNIVPADKKIYALRDITGTVDSIPLIASSIMSKKLASSADVIVIDMKVGKGAFMPNIAKATKLAKTMTKIAEAYNKKLICILTDMNEPLGRNIGNTLEVEEVIDFFKGIRDTRLEKVVLTISSYMVSYGLMIPLHEAKKKVNEVLDNSKAEKTFYKWIESQGGDIKKLNIKSNVKEIYSNKDGYIKEINAFSLGSLVRDLGAGRIKLEDKIDYSAGVVLNKVSFDKVKEGEKLATIYYNKQVENMEQRLIDSFLITGTKPKNNKVILKIIN